jgi:transposase
MQNATFFLSQTQYDWLAAQLPEPEPRTRPATPNNELLNGVLFVLKTGCRWQDIPSSICSHGYSSCWRRLHYWQEYGALQLTWQQVLVLLDEQGTLDLSLGNLDGSLVQSPEFETTGYSGKHHRQGTNLSLVTDRYGLPLAEVLTAGNRHDQYSAAATITKFQLVMNQQLGMLNADKGYDSKPFREYLEGHGIVANIPERIFVKKQRKPGYQSPDYDKTIGRFRAFVERTNAWLKYFRKLRYRWERTRNMFQAFVDLACLIICLRRVEI